MHTQFRRTLLGRYKSRLAWFAPLLMVLGVLTTAPQAHAQAALVSCVGTSKVTWTPGATNTPKPITIEENGNWITCLQLGQNYPLITTAKSTNKLENVPFGCEDLLGGTGPAATWTITWGDGRLPATSTYTWTGNVLAVDGDLVISLTGTITAGRYVGSPAEAEITYANLAANLKNACATPAGETSASGAATFTIE